jgi:sigma-B regulation protein RsbU (phosphoserine phosphatase)
MLYWPGWLSVAAAAALNWLCLLPSSIWILAVLTNRAVKRDVDAWLLTIPTFLYFGFFFIYNLALALSQAGWIVMPDLLLTPLPLPPFTMHWQILVDLIFLAALLAFLIRRFTQARQGEERYATQLEAARQIQQVLVPEAIAAVPGFAIDCVYHPAEEVGGDFFQILPIAEGGLLIVMGDVAGKGLPAAMMVSVLVGAIRTEASHTSDPATILASLNERMFGRSQGGFTTCLCLRLTPSGLLTASSAGHLSPYRNGEELTLPPAFPLGILSGIQYESATFQLKPGQRLAIVSDGVLEAQSNSGELLGFDRTRELSTKPAQAIAEAAQAFGQNDDITVVTVQFRGHSNPAAATSFVGSRAIQ